MLDTIRKVVASYVLTVTNGKDICLIIWPVCTRCDVIYKNFD